MTSDTGALDRAAEAVREIVERETLLAETHRKRGYGHIADAVERCRDIARECLAAVERQR